MTHMRLMTIAAFLSACAVACGTPPANAPAPASQPAATPAAAPARSASSPASITGAVAETMNAGGYTYMRLQDGTRDVWIAARELEVKVGERMTAPLEMPMENFHSNTLNRNFPLVYFVTQVAREGEALQAPPAQDSAPALMGSHGQAAEARPEPAAHVEPVPPPPGGLSIADVWTKRTALAGKTVAVRGTVVKYNGGIMNRNWLHLQDGSGTAAAATNDLTVTTDAQVKVGDVVTAKGVLGIGKDFGAGYTYQAILEQATVAPR